MPAPEFTVRQIGVVKSEIKTPADDCWANLVSEIILDPTQFTPESTRGLDDFSHLEVDLPLRPRRSRKSLHLFAPPARPRRLSARRHLRPARQRPPQSHRRHHLQNRAHRRPSHLRPRTRRHRWLSHSRHQALYRRVRPTRARPPARLVHRSDVELFPPEALNLTWGVDRLTFSMRMFGKALSS